MELRSSRRLTRSSGHTAQKRAFITRTVAPRVPSRLSSSGNKWLYRLRSGRFSVESERHAGTSRLGLSRSAYSRLGPASRGLLSGTRDDFSYRGRSGTVAIESRILRECSICVDKKGIRQFPSIECLPKCGHITSVCRSCIVRHIMGALERHEQWHQIPCLECREPLGEVFVESSVTRRDFQKLKAVAAKKALEAHPRFRTCLAAGCPSGQIHENIHTDIVVCKSCGSKSCFNHGVPWHEGYSCDRYDDSHPDAANLRTSEDRLRALAKKCPGEGCKYFVEKDGGCDSMWCSHCNTSWNWASAKFASYELVLS